MDEINKGLDMSGNAEQIIQVPIEDLHEFRGHTFRVQDDEAMKSLMESVKERGFITPLLAFTNEDGEPELISGHRRLCVARKLGLTMVPVIMKRVDRDGATVLMGISNFLHREKVLPSERAFTYKAMIQALRKKGNALVEDKEKDERTRDFLSKQLGIGSTQMFRYIRLTELIPDALNLVDQRKLHMRTAVELSYLEHEYQECIYEAYSEEGILPSAELVREMRGLQDKGDLTAERIRQLLAEQKGYQKVEDYKLVFHSQILCAFLKDCHSVSEREMRILRGLKLLEQQEKEWEAQYQEEQRAKWEEYRKRHLEGGGDTYGG